MGHPHNNEGIFNEDYFASIPGELIGHPNKLFNHHSRFVAAMEASILFSAVLPIGGSAIASSSQPIPFSNWNSNDITNSTNSTNNTRIKNM